LVPAHGSVAAAAVLLKSVTVGSCVSDSGGASGMEGFGVLFEAVLRDLVDLFIKSLLEGKYQMDRIVLSTTG
jgi:hypothetical protein